MSKEKKKFLKEESFLAIYDNKNKKVLNVFNCSRFSGNINSYFSLINCVTSSSSFILKSGPNRTQKITVFMGKETLQNLLVGQFGDSS
jgi:hypothetical protein